MKRNLKIFVYGTLKEGFIFHEEFLGNAKKLGIAKTDNKFALYITDLPYLVKEDSDGPVEGELYEVSVDELYKIDSLEGHPIYYKREMIDVVNESDEKVKVWAYLYPNIFKGKKGIKEYKYD